MATKLYFHDAANDLSGTFPSGEQSTTFTADQTASGANTLRKMDETIGAGQTSIGVASTGTTSTQATFYRMFCSPPLAAGNTINSSAVTFYFADAETNLNMNHCINGVAIYVWRPSTGSKISTIHDAVLNPAPTEPTSANSEEVSTSAPLTTSVSSTTAGDVIICEIWAQFTQAMGSSYTGTFYYDGTTENTTENAVVSNYAAYVYFDENTLTFEGVFVKPPQGPIVINQAPTRASFW